MSCSHEQHSSRRRWSPPRAGNRPRRTSTPVPAPAARPQPTGAAAISSARPPISVLLARSCTWRHRRLAAITACAAGGEVDRGRRPPRTTVRTVTPGQPASGGHVPASTYCSTAGVTITPEPGAGGWILMAPPGCSPARASSAWSAAAPSPASPIPHRARPARRNTVGSAPAPAPAPRAPQPVCRYRGQAGLQVQRQRQQGAADASAAPLPGRLQRPRPGGGIADLLDHQASTCQRRGAPSICPPLPAARRHRTSPPAG